MTEPFSFFSTGCRNKKVKDKKSRHLYIAPFTGKPEEQRFTIQSGTVTSTSSKQCGTVSSSPLSE